MPSADEIARLLDLEPHPEGGLYRETFRDTATVATGVEAARAASTAIYFLLRAGELSRWHRVDASEVWHWYAGAPLALTVADTQGRRDIRLGPDFAAGERPQAVVPAAFGSRRQASARGPSSAAPWHRASSSPASSWLSRASSRIRRGRVVAFSPRCQRQRRPVHDKLAGRRRASRCFSPGLVGRSGSPALAAAPRLRFCMGCTRRNAAVGGR